MTVPSYTEEDVELIAPIVHQDHWWDCDHGGNSGAGCEKDIARAVLAALSSAGRLVPPGSEVREEWMVWHRRPGGVEACHLVDGDGTFTDEEWARQHAAEDQPSEVRQRRVITTPWSPSVPDTKEGS